MFNMKLPVKITQEQLENLLRYANDCKFPVEKADMGTIVTYKIKHPSYGGADPHTPLAESVKYQDGGWTHWMFIRL